MFVVWIHLLFTRFLIHPHSIVYYVYNKIDNSQKTCWSSGHFFFLHSNRLVRLLLNCRCRCKTFALKIRKARIRGNSMDHFEDSNSKLNYFHSSSGQLVNWKEGEYSNKFSLASASVFDSATWIRYFRPYLH